MRVVFATCSIVPDGWPDDHEAASLLRADFRSWDDPDVDWGRYDRVVLRSVFTYQHHVDGFLAWCRAIGRERLRNVPELAAFNADKRYLSRLSSPSIPTTFVGSDDPLPELRGEVVVKPNVSAGARNTGRFSPATHSGAFALIDRIREGGGVALVQPYLSSVDTVGESAFVFFGNRLSHVLRKRAVLRPDEVAPVAREGFPRELGVAEAMLEDDLVFAGEASPAEHALADQVLAEVSETFGMPLFLRVDLVRDSTNAPILMEVEAIDPLLYFGLAPGASARFAAAVRAS
ncbi:MAG TPA: hypothetical protein VKD88_09290 [Gaiellaceae bacterium]|nr:hypothetical protein [Gaiellaceae bacterium]